MTGRLLKQKQNFLMQALYFGPVAKEEEEHRERVERVIDFLDLNQSDVHQLDHSHMVYKKEWSLVVH